MSSADRIRIVSQSRDLNILPFREAEQKHSRGIHWTEWLEDIERKFRYFKMHDPFDQKDALMIYGGREIARLEKALPDPCGKLNEYEKLKIKLNTHFLPQRNKYYARYLFLKITPRVEETTISFATRLRENALACEFVDNLEERILEHLILTSQDDHLVQKCIKKCWTLSEFLIEARLSEDVAFQVQKINESSSKCSIAKVKKRSKRKRNTDTADHLQPCGYCGLSGLHPKGRQFPAYGNGASNAIRLTILLLYAGQSNALKRCYISHNHQIHFWSQRRKELRQPWNWDLSTKTILKRNIDLNLVGMDTPE